MDLFNLYAKITLDDSEYKEGIEQAKERMTGASATFTSKAVAIGNAMYDMGKKAADSFAKIAQYAFDVGTSFDSSMANVAAISGATGEELETLRDKAKEMGAQTKFSASESADAFTYMAMAGWKTEQMLDGIEGIMNLAAASGENLAEVSDIVTDALTAFGLAAEDSGHFADILAAASNNANTNVSMLGDSFKYVAPVAGALGYNVEDVSTALGLMANSGVKAGQAGTALRAALSRLTDPTEEMWGALDNLGLALNDTTEDFEGMVNSVGEYNALLYNNDGTTKTFLETMRTLRSAFSDLSETEKAYYATNLFGQEAMSGMLAIINASDADFENLSAAIYNADGTAQSMADTMNDNLPGAITIMKSALEGLGISLYEKGSAPMQTLVENITEFIEKATEFVGEGGIESIVESLSNLIPVVELAVGAFVSLKAGMAIQHLVSGFQNAQVAISLLSMDIGKANLAQAALNGTMKAGEVIVALLTGKMTLAQLAQAAMAKGQAALNAVLNANPIGIVITLIGLLVTAFITAYTTNETFRNTINTAWESIKETISDAVAGIVTFFTETIPESAKKAVEWFQSIPEQMKEVGADLLEGLWDGISDKVEWLKGKVGGVVDTIKGWFTGKDGFDEHSPSKWANGVFRYVMDGGAEGLEDGFPALMGSVENITRRVKDSFDFDVANVDFASSGLGMSSAAIANSIGAADDTGGTATINLMFPDGTKLASYLLPFSIKVAAANGTPIANPQTA